MWDDRFAWWWSSTAAIYFEFHSQQQNKWEAAFELLMRRRLIEVATQRATLVMPSLQLLQDHLVRLEAPSSQVHPSGLEKKSAPVVSSASPSVFVQDSNVVASLPTKISMPSNLQRAGTSPPPLTSSSSSTNHTRSLIDRTVEERLQALSQDAALLRNENGQLKSRIAVLSNEVHSLKAQQQLQQRVRKQSSPVSRNANVELPVDRRLQFHRVAVSQSPRTPRHDGIHDNETVGIPRATPAHRAVTAPLSPQPAAAAVTTPLPNLLLSYAYSRRPASFELETAKDFLLYFLYNIEGSWRDVVATQHASLTRTISCCLKSIEERRRIAHSIPIRTRIDQAVQTMQEEEGDGALQCALQRIELLEQQWREAEEQQEQSRQRTEELRCTVRALHDDKMTLEQLLASLVNDAAQFVC